MHPHDAGRDDGLAEQLLEIALPVAERDLRSHFALNLTAEGCAIRAVADYWKRRREEIDFGSEEWEKKFKKYVRNKCRELRREETRCLLRLASIPDQPDRRPSASPELWAMVEEFWQAVEGAIDAACGNETERAAVDLFLEGVQSRPQSAGGIAAAVGMGSHGVRALLRSFKKQLARRLKDNRPGD
jgi:hypothetical protein